MIRCLLVAMILVSAGCATTSGGSGDDWTRFSDGNLDAWLVREATPTFAQTLSEHPRFRDETIRVAVMSGDEVALRTDALSASLRDAVHSRLLRVPGLTLVREDSAQDCRAVAHGYYLGLELTRIGRSQARAQLRLYDIVERKWVSGFTSQWEGQLSTAQQHLAAKPEVSENARGLRVLPFEAGQSDLLAAYLARDLACELSRRGDDELIVQPARHSAAGLVAGNLAAAHGIAVAADGQLVLDTRIHAVGDGLYQVWAILTPEVDSAGSTLAASAYARAPLLEKPRAAEAVDVASLGPEAAAAPHAAQPAATPARIAPVEPASPRNAPTLPLLRMTQIVTGNGNDRCSDKRWRGAARGNAAVISVDDCFAVEFDAHPDARVFIVAVDTADDAVRLYPSSCRPGGLSRGDRAAHRFPAGGGIGWDRRLGTETVFVIAARDAAAAARIERLVRGLPAPCDRGTGHAVTGEWFDQLGVVIDRFGGRVTVETLRIRHAPSRRHAGA